MDDDAAADDSEVLSITGHSRRKRGRKPLPESLPRVEVIHDLPEAEEVCAVHGVALEVVGEKTSEQLDIVPATVQVLRHIRKQ